MRFVIRDFKGIAPLKDAELLPDNFAQVCVNADLRAGTLRPFNGVTQVATLAKAGTMQSIYLWSPEAGNAWFHWTDHVHAVRGPVAGDTIARTYFTGDGVPKMTYSPIATSGGGAEYPTNSYDLGIPAPNGSATTTIQSLSGSITGMSNDAPIEITSESHGLTTSDEVVIDNITTSLGAATINGSTFTITVTGRDTFTLDGSNGSSEGTYSSGGDWTLEPPADATRYDDRAYAMRFVSALGELGPVTAITGTLEVLPGQQVDLANIPGGPASGNLNLSGKKLYRRSTGFTGGAWLHVADLSLGATSYSDTTPDDELGEVLEGEDWDQPPDDMIGLAQLANGSLIGFSKNQVCLSETYLPHAWPTTYRHNAPLTIIGGAAFGTNAVVFTVEDAYLLSASVPQAASLVPLHIKQGCVSARGIVALGNAGIAWPSPDGLFAYSSGGPQNLTEGYMKKRDWEGLIPSTIHASVYDGQYVGFYNAGGGDSGAIILDPRAGGAGLTKTDYYADASYYDAYNDTLYLADGSNIYSWDTNAAAPMTLTWRSKKFDVHSHKALAAAQVKAKSYADLTLRVYADGSLVHTQTVTSAKPFRIAAVRARLWEVEVEGTDEVVELALAESISELP